MPPTMHTGSMETLLQQRLNEDPSYIGELKMKTKIHWDTVTIPNVEQINLKPREDNKKDKQSTKEAFVAECVVRETGLEKFIRSIVRELDLHLVETVEFDMNSQGILGRWDDVFRVERTYTACLGISSRTYQCFSYLHKPQHRLAYFILEEHNKRCFSFLPNFSFYVMVFCYYDESRSVTKVDVKYDQISFYLHCLGISSLYQWVIMKVLTPLAVFWMRAFRATGLVNMFTFLLQIILIPMTFIWLLYI